MKLFVIIATLVACCYAAPTSDLQHPSPINPSVLIESKPQDKVILITDPTELAKFKRETNQPLYPTILPEEQSHHIAKRDNKPGHDTKAPTKPQAPAPPKKSPPHPTTTTKKPVHKSHPEPPKKPSSNKRNRRDVETFEKPQTLSVHSHHVAIDTPQGFQKPQTLPIILTEHSETTEHKRDIPVPLVAKHPHPEESPKGSSEEDLKKEESTENHAANKDVVQVADLSEPKPFHETLNLNFPTDEDEDEDESDILVDLERSEEITTTSEHPLVRPKPVSVAELFAKAENN